MKKYISILLIAFMVIGFAVSCKYEIVDDSVSGIVKIVFSSNDGKNKYLEQYGNAGDSITLLGNDWSVYGYEFAGWNTKADGTGTTYEEKDSASFDNDIVLYAKWDPVPFKFVAEGDTTVSIKSDIDGDLPLNSIRLQYKIDDGKWQNYVIEEVEGEYVGPTINLDAGHELFFKAGHITDVDYQNPSFCAAEDFDGNLWYTDHSYYYFVLGDGDERDGKVRAEGNIMFLLDETGKSLEVDDGAFAFLFYDDDDDNLTSVPMLPATKLARSCYWSMFDCCSEITSLPEGLLPATELANNCYYYMFEFTGITSLPEGLLPATKLAPKCYDSMFEGCLLTEIPENFLPATKLEDRCYECMFGECSNLTKVCNLPATELAPLCYDWMFGDCKSLVSVPTDLLPAKTMVEECYCWMFDGCSSLKNAPNLPATTLADGCYEAMFNGCTVLTEAPTIAVSLSETPDTDIANNVLTQVNAADMFKGSGLSGYESLNVDD